MSWQTRSVRILAGCGTAGLLLALAACGSNNNGNTASNTSGVGAGNAPFKQTVVSAQSTAVPYGSVAPVQVSPSALAAAGAQTLTEIATDNKYSQTTFTVKANQDVALTLKNQGQAVHNWHLLDATDADGKEIKGSLLDPGKSETIDFKITKPGTYHFQCDVHPSDMKGTLVVQ
ncbi:MAG TPA: cupredoxin domain-containing protein [Dehalococcoidia bacterium]|nr:cupredoxin domain-containing protein [Dehalococcoidia bacterium]